MLFLAGLINTAHAEQCTAYEFIHIKLDPEPSILDKLAKAEPLELHQFHGLNDGSHEDFNVGVSDYDESHVCALFLQDEQTGMQRDYQGVVWIQEWQIVKKNGESLAKDLPNHWACKDVDEGKPECDCGSMTGPKYAPERVYAGVFQQPYTNADSASGDKTLSKSGSEYRPKYDILCADDGKWHVCDKGGCECVEVTEGKSVGGAYACVSGSWVFCDRGCNEENKCNEPEAAEVCEDETLNVNDYVDVTNPGAMCGIEKATLNDIGTGSRAAATVIVEYTDGTEIKKVIECDDELNEIAVEGEKTCSIECKDTFILGETRTATINLCYQLPAQPPVEDPTPKPVEDPDPYVPIVPEEEEVPEEEPISYWEPDPVCEEFYAVLRVETNEGIVNVTDPCPYTKRILIDRTKGCAIVENFDDFPEDSYEIIDFPPCSSSMNLMEYMLQDVLGTSGLASGSAIWKPETSTCVGRIFEVKSHLKDESEEIELNVTILNTDEDDEECEYKIGLYNKEDEEITSEDWKELTAGEYHSIEIDSTSASSVLSFRRILSGSFGWSVKDLGGEYTVKLFSKKKGGDEALVDKQTLTVCKDDAFELCRTNITIKRKLIGSNYIETSQEKYGVVDVDEWMALEAMSRDDNQTFYWMLDNQMYTLFDAELCRTVNDEGTQSEIEFLTIINDPVYREIVQENYSKEPFYNKFKSMNEDPDFTYCYKTQVRDAIECGDLNYNWYSINKNGEDPIEITTIYKRDVKEWNQFQDINELTPLDEGVKNIPIDYAPTACAISMDRDFYRPEDSNGMVVTYSNAPENCALTIYAKKEESDYSGPDDKSPYLTKETLQVSGSGSYKYNFTGVDTQQNWSARLYCWDTPNNKICDARDQAKLNYTSITNVMSRIFMVSPLLEDTRNEMYWTRTGDGSIYVGAGFERYDRCELSCDGTNYGNNPCDLLTGCTNSGGSSSECDACLGEDCDRDSPGCPSSYKGDCWDSICRVETREYALEAEPSAGSFYGIPYKGDCPDVSDFRRKEIDMYERVWTPTVGGMPAKKETKCVLPGGVLAVTKINFPQPKGPSPLVDMAFAIDTSGSMGEAWSTVCNVIDTVVTKLKERDVDLQYTIYGLGTKQNCATESIPGHSESWGPASVTLARTHPWREGARRVVIPISDEEMIEGDGGTDWNDADIQAAADRINENDATVYGLWVGGKSKIIHEMKFLSEWTDGKASLFSDAQTVTELLIEMAIPEDPPVVVANNASLKAEKRDDDGMVWEIFQEDDTEYEFVAGEIPEEEETGGIASLGRVVFDNTATRFSSELLLNNKWTEVPDRAPGTYKNDDNYIRNIAKWLGEGGSDDKILLFTAGQGGLVKTDYGQGVLVSSGFNAESLEHSTTELTEELLSGYDQLWLIGSILFTAGEKKAIKSFYENRGDLLLSEGFNDISDYLSLGVEIKGSSVYSHDENMWKLGVDGGYGAYTRDHEIWNGISTRSDGEFYLTSLGSVRQMEIENPNVETTITYLDKPIGAVLDNMVPEASEETPVGEETGEETSEPVTLTRPPDFTIIEKGNMPFKIPYTNIEKTGNTYTITRIYVPEDSKDYGKRLVVTSDVLMNYTLMESSKIYVAEANTTYVSQVRKDKYYVSCDYDKCDISGSKNYGYSSCGGVSSNLLSSSLRGEAREYRKDIESELIDLNYTETHRLEVPGVSHDDIPCRTLKQLKIEGTLDLVEVDDSIIMYSPIDDPFRITIYPDILSGFVLKVNNSYISYTNTLFPVRHQLVRRGSSAGADIEWRNFHDNYASLDERFDFPEQCKNICPFESCTCPVDDRMDNTCLDPDTLEDSHRTDCVCVSEGCYPNPCVTNRTYHEEEGSIIVNGDFESEDLDDYWKTNDGSITGIIGDELGDLVTGEDAEAVAYGHPGRVLKLNGAIEQAIPTLYARPFNQICLEYAVLEELGVDDDGKLDMEVTVIKGDGTEDAELFNIWDNSGDCRDKLGWNRECVTVKDAIKKVKLESDVEVLVDNVNAGNFYDFASIYTYDLSNIEYMDNYMKGWESGGLFGVDRVDHIGNMYTFHARTFPRITMEVHNFNIDMSFMDSIEKGTITPALKSELARNGLELSEYAVIDKTGVPDKQEWKLVDRGLTYEISTGLDPETGDEVLNIYSSGLKKAHFTEEDFRNGLMIIQTYYGDIEIPLSENVFESGDVTEEEPEAAKKLLDMVFVIDSSSSMNREWENLCDNIDDIVSTLKSDGVTLKPTIYHLGADKNPSDTCSLDQGIIITVDENGDAMTDEKGEAWVLGTKWAVENHAWTEGYGRVLIPISDTEIIHGSDRTNQDVSCAKDAANANDVTVHGLYGIETLYDDDPSQEMIELSTGTGGSAEQIDSMDSATFAGKIKDIAKEEAVEKIEEETVESSGLCYTLNLTFRKPTRVSIKTDPSGFTIPKGTRVTVTGTLSFMDGTPVPNEKLYVNLEGASVWDCEPIGLYKEYIFDFREIVGSREQQGRIREILNLYDLYVNDIPLDEALETAVYTKSSDDNISITSSAGDIGRLEIIEGVAYFISTEELAIPLGASGTREGEELTIYPSEEDQDVAYMITDSSGQASFTFKPRGTSVQVGTTGGKGAPSTSSVGFHTIGINSPLFSREFLMLVVILVLGVFSYRYFRDKRLDIYSWWQDYKGKK